MHSAAGAMPRSADLEIRVALRLKGGRRCDSGRDQPDVAVRASLREVDLEGREGDLAEIDLEPMLCERFRAGEQLGIDRLLRPGCIGKILEKELDAGRVRHDDQLERALVM